MSAANIRDVLAQDTSAVPAEPKSVEFIQDIVAAEAAGWDISELPEVGYDSETTALSPHDGRQRLAQFAAPDGRCWVFDLDHVPGEFVARILSRSRAQVKVGQNLKFDQKFASHQLGVPDLGPLYDTMLAGQLLAFGDMSEHVGLEALAWDVLGVRLPKEMQTSDWGRADLSPEQIGYAARDALVPLALREKQARRLRSEGLTNVASIEFGAVPAVAAMELTGIILNGEKWLRLCARNHEELLDVQGQLYKALKPRALTLFEGIPTLNLDSHIQVKVALHELDIPVPVDKDGKETTRKYKLQPLALQYPAVATLLRHRELSKRESSYGPDWLDKIHTATGRIHGDINQIGSETGRMAGRKPNLLQIPKDAATRGCFEPRPGWVFVDADYSQFELRILADLCRDPNFCRAFIDGKDFHRYSAWMVERMSGHEIDETEVSDKQRNVCKNLNFGIVYGIGVARYAFTTGLTLEQAEQIFKYYFGAFPGLERWLKRQAHMTLLTMQARTLAGRKVVYQQDVKNSKEDRAAVERYGKNYPIQGTNADIVKRALYFLWHAIATHKYVKIALTIHDEIILEARADWADWAQQTLTACMMRAAQEYIFAVPVSVGCDITTVWQKT